MVSRRHVSTHTSISSTGSDSYATPVADSSQITTEDYVGRCLPIDLYDILRVRSHFPGGSRLFMVNISSEVVGFGVFVFNAFLLAGVNC